MRINTHFKDDIPAGFLWFNEPREFSAANGLHITTDPNTDFWQRTHYGFRNDNGHALLTKVVGDFCITTCVQFEVQNQYDQCGLFVRLDEDNWIKASAEFIDGDRSELGSVVTNLGYSDWATTEISSTIHRIWYRISKRGSDFLLQNSFDGQKWLQMRITHLHAPFEALQVGIYACSPVDGRFHCTFEQIVIDDNEWESH
jgi:regulation of enolase protein 1 (concanavalin A-like superfamily)